MLITKIREFNNLIGDDADCRHCEKRIYGPVAIIVNNHSDRDVYHPKCIMQIVYGVLADFTNEKPEAEH